MKLKSSAKTEAADSRLSASLPFIGKCLFFELCETVKHERQLFSCDRVLGTERSVRIADHNVEVNDLFYVIFKIDADLVEIREVFAFSRGSARFAKGSENIGNLFSAHGITHAVCIRST